MATCVARDTCCVGDIASGALAHAFTFLNMKELATVSAVSKYFNDLSEISARASLFVLGDRKQGSSYVQVMDELPGSYKYKLNELSKRRVIMIGGQFSPTRVDSMNLTTGKWVRSTDSTEDQVGAVSTALNGEVYIISGYESPNTMRKYCPALNRWEQLPSIPVPQRDVGCCSGEGTVYVTGGACAQSQQEGTQLLTYCPDSSIWTSKAPLPCPRRSHGCMYFADHVWVVGGVSSGQPSNTSHLYHPLSDTWTAGPDLTYPRHGLGLVVVGGSLYAVGGDNDCTIEQLCISPHGCRWVVVGAFPQYRRHFTCSSVDDRILIVGGLSRRGSTMQSWMSFCTPSCSWEPSQGGLGGLGLPSTGLVSGIVSVVPDAPLCW